MEDGSKESRHTGPDPVSRVMEVLTALDSGHSTKLMALSKPKGFRRNDDFASFSFLRYALSAPRHAGNGVALCTSD